MTEMMPSRPDMNDMMRRRHRPRSRAESLITGLAVGGGFMAFWALGGHQAWALFGAFFGGLLPAARGIAGMIEAREHRSRGQEGSASASAPSRTNAPSSDSRGKRAAA